MISYMVGAAVFVLSTSVLLNFVVEPPGNPGSSLEHQDLKSKAATTLDVLMGTSGHPAEWDSAAPDGVTRLGLIEQGTTVRMDPGKFAAVARGRFTSADDVNGAVDYPEAKRALGLDGYDFHIRAQPVIPEDPTGFYGTAGMQEYRIAYVQNATAPTLGSAAAVDERAGLDALDVGFDNRVRTTLGGLGDVYDASSTTLKSTLIPLLGTSVSQVNISRGTGNAYDFHRVNATDFDDLVIAPGSDKALALAYQPTKKPMELGYTKGREIRALLVNANMSDQVAATLAWKEHVNTNGTTAKRDDGDYGFVEVSPDGGATWLPLTNTPELRSQDTAASPQTPGLWKSRSVLITAANCPGCVDNEDVRVAFHWVADGDEDRGRGWIIDDVTVTVAGITTVRKDFEAPEYQLVVIGSGVPQRELTAAEVKNGLRDYVTSYGGRILVFGGDTNNQWLQPLFHVGLEDASPGVANPDPTHPLLTTPNPLDWKRYDNGGMAWDFGPSGDDRLFNMVVGDGDAQHILSASTSNAFGASGGGVILTAYQPWRLEGPQRLGFLANCITFGHYHHLYMDVGPEVPSDVPVASATRTAIMEKTRDETAEYGEISVTLYLWRGNASAAAASNARPSTPQSFAASRGDGTVSLTWSPPSDYGPGTFLGYRLYRGTAPNTYTRVTDLGTNVFTYADTGSNGVTYYYRLSARNTNGEGPNATEVSATPAAAPSAPEGFSAAGGAGHILLTWNDPASNGGAAITNYEIWRGASADALSLFTTVGAVNEYLDQDVGSAETKHYALRAVNGVGASPLTAVVGGSALSVPSTPPAPVATTSLNSIRVTWTAPTSVAIITHYEVWAGATAQDTAWLTNVTALTYEETGLASGQTRFYRVRAVSAVGPGGLSDATGAETLRVSTAPTSPSATGGPTRIALSWAPPTDPGGTSVATYRIYRGAAIDALTLLTETTLLAYNDEGLASNVTWHYRIAANTSVGEGEKTNVLSATTWASPSKPVLTATGAVNSIALSWTPSVFEDHVTASVSHYEIWRGTSAGGVKTNLANATADPLAPHQAVTYTDMSAIPGQTYYYQVIGVSAPLKSAASDEKSGVATGVPPLGL